jgi:putative oxidoreductase
MELGLLVLRVVVGALFFGHGTQKLFGWFGGHGPAGTAGFFESLGMKPGRPMAYAAGACEALGGLLLALGLFVPAAAAMLIAVMLVAIWTVHRVNGLWVTDQGYEYNLVLIAAAFTVAAIGAGDWSLDNALNISWHGEGWALAALACGIVGAWAAVAAGHLAARRTTGTHRPVATAR